MNGIEYLKPDKYQTKNLALIKKAFRTGFKSGIAFMNESESYNSDAWRRKAFKKFVEETNITE
jgi:hypothetical protein